jgi:uncharacterized protein (TIGR00255 family)
MTKSMTGFGKANTQLSDKKIKIEIRSLNSKAFDLNLKIPNYYKEFEHKLRSELSKELERGKIEVYIAIENKKTTTTSSINNTLAKQYYKELNKLAKDLGEKNSNILDLALKMPDVLKAETKKTVASSKEWSSVKKAINEAIKEFQKFRLDEGKVLGKDFKSRITKIDSLLTKIKAADSKRIKNIRTRIKNNLAEVISENKIDKNRFEQEIIFYIEKLDITEEKLRLKTHLNYFIKTLSEKSSGRKLNFISQEIGREINTIGSKANNAEIQQLVVRMKDELEKIKEQLLNVL